LNTINTIAWPNFYDCGQLDAYDFISSSISVSKDIHMSNPRFELLKEVYHSSNRSRRVPPT